MELEYIGLPFTTVESRLRGIKTVILGLGMLLTCACIGKGRRPKAIRKVMHPIVCFNIGVGSISVV
jgi:hypothetical protein